MGKHVLFTLNPWTDEKNQGPFYCPDCGVIEGFFAYSPGIRKNVEIILVDYERPRQKVIECLGEEHQDCPVLVLDPAADVPEGAKKSFSTGKMFIDDALLICDYLGNMFGGTRPHP